MIRTLDDIIRTAIAQAPDQLDLTNAEHEDQTRETADALLACTSDPVHLTALQATKTSWCARSPNLIG